MPTLRKRTVFYPCPAHVSRYACETRQRRAECFVEGGWPSPCTAGERCTMKPGTDFYAPEFVAEHDVFTVPLWWDSRPEHERADLVKFCNRCEACGNMRDGDPDFCPACLADMATRRADNRTAAQVYADAWAYVVETLNPRSTARTANGRDLEAYELRMRRGARPDYDVMRAVAVYGFAAAQEQIWRSITSDQVADVKPPGTLSDAIADMPKIGGEVALADGFVIRVRRVNRYVLAGDVANASGEPCRVGDAIDRFNALQEG